MAKRSLLRDLTAFLLAGCLFCFSQGLFGFDRELTVGDEINRPWGEYTHLDSLKLIDGKRGTKDLVLTDREYLPDERTDLLLHFNASPYRDETGNYRVIGPHQQVSSLEFTLGGASGAFHKGYNTLSLHPGRNSLFVTGGWQDFSLEFWMYPINLNDREEIFSWNTTKRDEILPQWFRCRINDRRLVWEFHNFFGPESKGQLTLQGPSRLLPRTWNHHLLRFDAETGLMEYLVNGIPEGVIYVTQTGSEGSTVYLPSTDRNGTLLVGRMFTGLLDELRVTRSFVTRPVLDRYRDQMGVYISAVIDLEHTGTRLKTFQADYETPGSSEVYFYYRISNEVRHLRRLEGRWQRLVPGDDLPRGVEGRYIQLRADLLSDGSGDVTPVLSRMTLTYEPDLPPSPPSHIVVTPRDGSVVLNWRRVNERDVRGYMIYYGHYPGVYNGEGSAQGVSPVDAGDTTTFTLTGLQNGRLYYFSVVSYDSTDPPHQSVFSAEVSARPSRILP
jgi:hypothetical protein